MRKIAEMCRKKSNVPEKNLSSPRRLRSMHNKGCHEPVPCQVCPLPGLKMIVSKSYITTLHTNDYSLSKNSLISFVLSSAFALYSGEHSSIILYISADLNTDDIHFTKLSLFSLLTEPVK